MFLFANASIEKHIDICFYNTSQITKAACKDILKFYKPPNSTYMLYS